MNVAEDNNQGQPQQQCEHAGHKAWRIRGGGAAKVCSLLNSASPEHTVDFVLTGLFSGCARMFLVFW